MMQSECWLVSLGVSVGPANIPSKTCTSKIQSCMSGLKGTPKGTQKRKKGKPCLQLMASVHLNMDYGASVLKGPLWVMEVSWAASKFKATSYYSVHPLILSAAHVTCLASALASQKLARWFSEARPGEHLAHSIAHAIDFMESTRKRAFRIWRRLKPVWSSVWQHLWSKSCSHPSSIMLETESEQELPHATRTVMERYREVCAVASVVCNYACSQKL